MEEICDMTAPNEQAPEMTAQTWPEHSHDEMYLVSHHQGRSMGPDYFSCHHCPFIRVPVIALMEAALLKADKMADDADDLACAAPDNFSVEERMERAIRAQASINDFRAARERTKE